MAELDDMPLDPAQLAIPQHQGSLVVETAGGLMVPLTRNWLQIDQLVEWQLPIVLVARSGLGTLNHTLLSLEALRRRNLTVLGLILNGPLHADNPGTLKQFGDVPVLAQLPPQASLSATVLLDLIRQEVSSFDGTGFRIKEIVCNVVENHHDFFSSDGYDSMLDCWRRCGTQCLLYSRT